MPLINPHFRPLVDKALRINRKVCSVFCARNQRVADIRRPSSQSAFSLIEVTLALGVAGFAMVAILGLIPMGLTNFQNTIRINVESDIVEQLARQLQSTDFNKISTYDNYSTSYDYEGRQSTTNKVFNVNVSLSNAQIQGGTISAPSTNAVLYKVALIRITFHGKTNQYTVSLAQRSEIATSSSAVASLN